MTRSRRGMSTTRVRRRDTQELMNWIRRSPEPLAQSSPPSPFSTQWLLQDIQHNLNRTRIMAEVIFRHLGGRIPHPPAWDTP